MRPMPSRSQVTGGRVRFENVVFDYDPRRPILKGVSFDIPAGHKVAVVGPSGSGKSTLVRLLFRFYDVTGGSIAIDGQDVRSVGQLSLRRAIGVVPQDTVLFNDTVAANIAYGRPGASQAEIEAAAGVAQIHDFIAEPARRLRHHGRRARPQALRRREAAGRDRAGHAEEPAGPGARRGDLGPRQPHRAGAAGRARARSPPGRTTLVIAHRLSTVIDADEIIVLEHGSVIERGTHMQLLARRRALRRDVAPAAGEPGDRGGGIGWQSRRRCPHARKPTAENAMDLQLDGKLALVTGSTAGIGLAIAKALAGEGARSSSTAAARPGSARRWRVSADPSQARLEPLAADLGSAEGAELALQRFPDLDILVNNLGIFEPRPFEEIRDDEWEQMIEVNFMSGVRLSRHHLPRMKASGLGPDHLHGLEVGGEHPNRDDPLRRHQDHADRPGAWLGRDHGRHRR